MQALETNLPADDRVGQKRFAAVLPRRQQVLIQQAEIVLDPSQIRAVASGPAAHIETS